MKRCKLFVLHPSEKHKKTVPGLELIVSREWGGGCDRPRENNNAGEVFLY